MRYNESFEVDGVTVTVTGEGDGLAPHERDLLADSVRSAFARMAPPKVEVFQRPECIFRYCPNPERCQTGCVSPRGGTA